MSQDQFNFLYNKAKELMQNTKDPSHDWGHIKRVMENVFKIKVKIGFKTRLNENEIQPNLDNKILTVATVWHDISYAFYKAGFLQYFKEAKRSIKIAKEYFQQAQLAHQEISLICDIILHHGLSELGFLNRNKTLYHQLIQDADTLDGFFNEKRIKEIEKVVKHSLYWFLVIKILKPLFFNFLTKNKKYLLILPESVKVLEEQV